MKVRRWITCAFIVLLISGGAFWLAVLRPATKARNFLRQFAAIDASSASLSQIHSLFKLYNHSPVPNIQTCMSSDCTLEVRFANSLLAALRMAPPTDLRISATFSRGNLSYLGAAYGVGKGKDIPSVYVTEFIKVDGAPPLSIHEVLRPEGSVREVHLKAISGRDREIERKLFAFDTSCLRSIRGCRTATDLLPSIEELQRIQNENSGLHH